MAYKNDEVAVRFEIRSEMTKEDTITLVRSDSKMFRLEINKDLIGVGKDYIILELSEDALMQLGKLAMDITNSEGIKQLTLTL